jgi:hypothetical protein
MDDTWLCGFAPVPREATVMPCPLSALCVHPHVPFPDVVSKRVIVSKRLRNEGVTFESRLYV